MTARLDKLEEAGLIRRKPDLIDRRMLVIELTEQGEQLIDAAAASRFTEARDSLPPFTSFELKTLEDLLRRWLFTLEATQRHQTMPLGLIHQQRPQVKK
jgi:DNA-binding MarR family transcriptional regulator